MAEDFRYRPMVLTGPEPRAEQRSNLENPSVSLVDAEAWATVFGNYRSAADIPVNPGVAMSVPAIWCAVTFLGNCMAALPLNLHQKAAGGATEQLDRSTLAKMLAGKVNDEFLTSFNWRRDMMTSTLLTGRGLTFIERWGNGDGRYLWPLQHSKTTVKRTAGRLSYKYRDTGSKVETYGAGEVIDIKMLGALDGVGVFDPVQQLRDTIGLAVALRNYASRFFQNGGVPPLAMEGPAASPAAVGRAKSDSRKAVQRASKDEDNIIYLPAGHKLTAVGINPEKSQLLDAQKFIVEEVSRIYNLPPAFLHSLLNATYSNVEQQDLNLVKHCVVHWVQQWEQELNAKLFGKARARYVEFDLNALLRGDFVSRMAAYSSAIQNAVIKPNEARRRERLPDAPGGDRLYMNGAIAPIDDDDRTTTGSGEVDNPGDPETLPEVDDPPSGGPDPTASPDTDTED